MIVRILSILPIALIISLALFACGEDRKSDSEASSACEVGATKYCACDDGVQGRSTCLEGNVWSDCVCGGSDPSGGTSGGGNMDAGFATGLATGEAVCGDGVRTPFLEDCEGEEFSILANSCEILGLGSGEISCTADCQIDTSMCTNDGTTIGYGEGSGQSGSGGSDDEEDAGI